MFSNHTGIKWEINKRTTTKYLKTQGNITHISTSSIKEAVSKEIKVYTELNGNKNTSQNIWNEAIAVMRRNFMALKYLYYKWVKVINQ